MLVDVHLAILQTPTGGPQRNCIDCTDGGRPRQTGYSGGSSGALNIRHADVYGLNERTNEGVTVISAQQRYPRDAEQTGLWLRFQQNDKLAITVASHDKLYSEGADK